MTVTSPTVARHLRRFIAPLALGLILLVTGCYYNGHHNIGATEKWVGSDINYVPKLLGTPFIGIVDGLIGPATMLWDQLAYDEQYNPKHKYFSYAGSRTIGRSDMGWGYQILAGIPVFVFDTVYLLITGPVDLIWVLGFGRKEPAPEGPSDTGSDWNVATGKHAHKSGY